MRVRRIQAVYCSCNFCQRGEFQPDSNTLVYPYKTVIEVSGNSLVALYCDDCFKKLIETKGLDNKVSDMPEMTKRLDQYIEFATATKRFADVGFYEDIKAHIDALNAKHEEQLKEQREACAVITWNGCMEYAKLRGANPSSMNDLFRLTVDAIRNAKVK